MKSPEPTIPHLDKEIAEAEGELNSHKASQSFESINTLIASLEE